MRLLRVLACGVAASVLSLAPRPADAGASRPFDVVATVYVYVCGHNMSLESARTAAEYADLWHRSCLPIPAPEVDFRHDMVIVYFMGTKPSGGWRPEVTALEHSGRELVVHVVDHVPHGGSAEITDPVVVVVTRKWPGTLALDRHEEQVR